MSEPKGADRLTIGAAIRWVLAVVVCTPALFLPYRARVRYNQLIAWAVHAPSIAFGRLGRYLLRQLSLKNPYDAFTER